MIEAVIAGLFGLLIGSFLNVCIHRWPRDLSVVYPGSHCVTCGSGVAWYDNIPLVSFALLGARCRNCRSIIHWRYPLVELLTGLLFAVAAWKWGVSAMAAKVMVFAAMQVGMIFSDLETRLLPDEFTKGGIGLGLVASFFVPIENGFFGAMMHVMGAGQGDPRFVSLVEAGFSAALVSAAMWAVGYLFNKVRNKDGLGFGDVKMVAMMGAWLGFGPVLAAILYGSLLSLVLGVGYAVYTKRDLGSYELPFGTFLGIGALWVAFR